MAPDPYRVFSVLRVNRRRDGWGWGRRLHCSHTHEQGRLAMCIIETVEQGEVPAVKANADNLAIIRNVKRRGHYSRNLLPILTPERKADTKEKSFFINVPHPQHAIVPNGQKDALVHRMELQGRYCSFAVTW